MDVILHFDLGYMDLLELRTSLDYLSWLKKDVFAMIQQLDTPTFFVTFMNVKSKWIPLLKCLYDLNNKKLGFNIPFDKLEPKHVANIIWSDPITCARYYDHRMRYFIHFVDENMVKYTQKIV